MPSIRENMRVWGKRYDWSSGGDEWSSLWGGPEAQWYWVLYPRIHGFVPAGTIVEIGPGFGRWTHYLKDLCASLVLVDVNARCIDACRTRFATERHLRYEVNDGMSLPGIDDDSVDFAFSFDSLVHVEDDVMGAYLEQLSKKLTPAGVAFLHHSNLGALDAPPEPSHWRGASVSADSVRRRAEAAGLACVAQELVNFGDRYVGYGDELIDCFTTVCGPESPYVRPTRVTENADFMAQSTSIAKVASLYNDDPPTTSVRPSSGRLRRLFTR